MELIIQYKKVLECLKLLSASEAEQIELLPDFADVPEDVISSFESAFLLLPQLIESDCFCKMSIASILRLYNKMEWCIRNIGLDDFSNDEWNKVRELAKKTLILIGEPFDNFR